jgi:PKD repeat protein
MIRQVLFTRKMLIILGALLMVMALLAGSGGLHAAGTSTLGDQPFCLSDTLLSQSLKQNPSLRKTMEEQEGAIRNFVENRTDKGLLQQGQTSDFIIPVVVYAIHNGGPENISEQQVNSQITALNNAFSGQGIRFCLATQQGGTPLPGSPTPGIIRIQSPLTNHLTSDESSLKALSTLPGENYLRIWVVKDIDNNSGVVGYARFPGTVAPALEGIVMRYDVFGDVATCGCSNLIPNYDQGKILAHEVGHYLYLYHTFQGGCTGVSASDCATMGDYVCDTPQIAVANTGCPGPVSSCNGTPALLNNQMDYTNDLCRNAFTTGQETRMTATINTIRQQLVSPSNLVFTGVQCAGLLNASFSASNYNPCTNQSITLDALNIGGATYAWDFGDSSTGSGDPVTHTYTTPGTYTVTLTVTSGGNTVSSTQQVFVTNCAPISSSQNNWYFGRIAGLNFSSGAPVPALGAFINNTINSDEGCATQSDSSGNLLFYSDGAKLWDKNHVLLNPATPLSGHNSASQAALSVPMPGNPNRYYLFTLPFRFFAPVTYFGYSIVDVTGGNASLVSINTPVTLPAGATRTGEAATAVQKCNGDYWVIVHGFYMDPIPLRNSFYVYSVTASGVTLAGVYNLGVPSDTGQLKMSPDGTLLACSGDNTVICDFDRASGVLSNPKNLIRGDYGITFSPNSHVLYLSPHVAGETTLYQYDLLHPDPQSTEQIVPTRFIPVNASMQLGPDQKVYMALTALKHLAVINYPNNLVSADNPNACGFNFNGPSLVTSANQGIFSAAGLPNMMDALPTAQVPADFSYDTSSCSTVNFSATACASSYAWNFGDSTTSTAQNPTHTYAANGSYTVTLTLNGSTTVTKTVVIGLSASSASIFGPSTACMVSGNPPFSSYSANAQPGLLYNWTVMGGTISGVSNHVSVDVVWQTLPGTVQLTLTDPATGCTRVQTLTVTINCNTGFNHRVYDFTGDSRTDFTVLTLGAAGTPITWKTLRNPASSVPNAAFIRIFDYGIVGDSITPNNYLGDGKNEVGVWRTGNYYISPFPEGLGPIAPTTVINWGTTGDNLGRDGDYDGDGTEDPTIIRVQSSVLHWYIKGSAGTNRVIPFGRIIAGFNTLAFQGADFNGDGRDDLVMCNANPATGANNWWIGDSITGQVLLSISWGNFTVDYFINPDDYTGDGKADLVVWRGGGTGPEGGAWYIRDTQTGNMLPPVIFGIADASFLVNDVPLRGDYDGDGKADIAVFRPSTREWYWLNSSNPGGLKGVQQWGGPGDIPLPSFFNF